MPAERVCEDTVLVFQTAVSTNGCVLNGSKASTQLSPERAGYICRRGQIWRQSDVLESVRADDDDALNIVGDFERAVDNWFRTRRAAGNP